MSASLDPQSARYFALLYSPLPQRTVLDSLFGIEREVSSSLRPGLDHHVAHSRLQWWREECERAASGKPVHPLAKTLVDALGGATSSLAGLTGFVDVAVWDLAGATFETRRELTVYCERWAAAMIEPLVAADAKASANWRAVGTAMCEIELLANLAHEAHYGRLRVPLEELDSANADPGTLAKPPWPETVAALLRARHTSLRGELTRATADLDRQQQPFLRGLLVWVALTWRTSLRAEHALPDRLRPVRFTAISDTWFAWNVARRATMGRFRLE